MRGHSSIIHIFLKPEFGEPVKISHLGGGFFRVIDNPEIPAGKAVVQLLIDGEEHLRPIELTEPIPENCDDRIYFKPVEVAPLEKSVRLEGEQLLAGVA